MSIRSEKRRYARRRRRVRSGLFGTAERPRMIVRKTNRYLYVRIMDDSSGKVLVDKTTLSKDGKPAKSMAHAKKLGLEAGEAAVALGIKKIVFDRGLSVYHGRVKAVAEAAREKGLEF